MYSLYIPKDDELCPEWRIVINISFQGENNFVKAEISFDDIERISKASGWVQIGNYHFNKDKAESFIFFTEYKDLNRWVPYSKEGWDSVLKQELNNLMADKVPEENRFQDLLDKIRKGV